MEQIVVTSQQGVSIHYITSIHYISNLVVVVVHYIFRAILVVVVNTNILSTLFLFGKELAETHVSRIPPLSFISAYVIKRNAGTL